MLDIFRDNAFGLTSLTLAVNQLPYQPRRLGALGLFSAEGITTTTAVVEYAKGSLALLPTVPRGGPATKAMAGKRSVKSFAVPHIPLEDTILPEDVQNVRAFGSDNVMEGVAAVVNNRLATMRQSHEATLEYHRVGAIQGKVLDADGTTELFDLFTEFGLTETEAEFSLLDATADIRTECLAVKRAVETALGNAPYQRIHAFCGADFFDAFVSHPDVKSAYDRWQEGTFLRNDPRDGFEFAGIVWEEYRGTVSGKAFIGSEIARFVPSGVDGLLIHRWAPADFMETVNTVGLEVYAKQERLPLDRGILLHTQSNPLTICTRPKCLVKGVIADAS